MTELKIHTFISDERLIHTHFSFKFEET